jgi:hypothetical protein
LHLLPATEEYISESETENKADSPHSPFVKKPIKRRPVTDMFMDFMKAHDELISRMIKENENRIKLEALSRRQVKLKPPTPKDLIKGRQDY